MSDSLVSPGCHWNLRMAAAERGIWTAAQLRRVLAERTGLRLSASSMSALMTTQPSQLKTSTLAALCVALDCTPNDLIEIQTQEVVTSIPRPEPVRGPTPGPGLPPSPRRPSPSASI